MSASSSSDASLAVAGAPRRPQFCYDLAYPSTRDPSEPLRIILMGCAGTGKPIQKLVAEAMKRYVKKNPVDMGFFLGDNIYKKGATGPMDVAFKPQFEDVYRNEELSSEAFLKLLTPRLTSTERIRSLGHNLISSFKKPNTEPGTDQELVFLKAAGQEVTSPLKNLPWFGIVGNHDLEKCNTLGNQALAGDDIGDARRGNYQVARTFVHHKNKDIQKGVCSKQQARFERARTGTKLVLGKEDGSFMGVRGWLMPHRFYRLNFGNAVFLFLDSNTFARDYLLFEKFDGKKRRENPFFSDANLVNQFAWLHQQLPSFQGKQVYLMMHHGLVTVGKRALNLKYDTRLYLNHEHQKHFKLLGLEGYNDILKYIVLDVLHLDQYCSRLVVFNAHDHHAMYHIDSRFTEVVDGNAGDPTQNFYIPTQHHQQPFHAKKPGYVTLEIPLGYSAGPSTSADQTPLSPELATVKFHVIDETTGEETHYKYFLGHKKPLREEAVDPYMLAYAKRFKYAARSYLEKQCLRTKGVETLQAKNGITEAFHLYNFWQQTKLPKHKKAKEALFSEFGHSTELSPEIASIPKVVKSDFFNLTMEELKTRPKPTKKATPSASLDGLDEEQLAVLVSKYPDKPAAPALGIDLNEEPALPEEPAPSSSRTLSSFRRLLGGRQ